MTGFHSSILEYLEAAGGWVPTLRIAKKLAGAQATKKDSWVFQQFYIQVAFNLHFRNSPEHPGTPQNNWVGEFEPKKQRSYFLSKEVEISLVDFMHDLERFWVKIVVVGVVTRMRYTPTIIFYIYIYIYIYILDGYDIPLLKLKISCNHILCQVQ